jgi:hypothetical protein
MGMHSFLLLRSTNHNPTNNHSGALQRVHVPARLGEKSESTTMLEVGLHSFMVLHSSNHDSRDNHPQHMWSLHMSRRLGEESKC